ncbi:hypothetical protein L6452_33744 [Arctium lappa]|uniref:Uncharacterized protein n=1 Tax=Arctium lappa TaxID=4217 RepID=A0ACB8YKG0_ARCLA|nr:hypothetical protein L6452_33744 [Arctium lappa]
MLDTAIWFEAYASFCRTAASCLPDSNHQTKLSQHLQDAAVDPAEPRRRDRTEQPISNCYRAPIVTKTQLAVYATAQPRPRPKAVCNMNPTNSSYTVSNPDPHFQQAA